MGAIIFETDDGKQMELSILDETRINGIDYILVTEDAEVEELEVMILRAVPGENDDEDIETFVTVDDEDELKSVSDVFAQQLAEDEIELEIN